MNAEAQNAIHNLINGNLSDAKNIAQDIEAEIIARNAEDIGFDRYQALLIASYLKGIITYQNYCDNYQSHKIKF
jgi:hypothetical protein